MKLAIIGLPQSGKNTVFEALTSKIASKNKLFKNRLGTIKVKDTRLEVLSNIYDPQKTVYANVEYFLPGKKKNGQNFSNNNDWSKVRNCDALIHVIKNFDSDKVSLLSDFTTIDQELILSDTIVVEKRLEKLALDKQKGKKNNSEEVFLLKQCLDILEKEKPLRHIHEKTVSKILKGYSFLSAKPMLTLINNSDENNTIPKELMGSKNKCMVIRGKLERELAQMNPKDSKKFFSEFNILKSATDNVIKKSYSLLGLISFFTVGKDEVRAWTIKKNTTALDAAKIIHSDIKKGFIRAEIVSYLDLLEAKTYGQARKNGNVRLEGKNYIICDGDIINFRFNI